MVQVSWCSDDGVGRDSALGVTAKTSRSGQNTRLSGSNDKCMNCVTESKLSFIMYGIKT